VLKISRPTETAEVTMVTNPKKMSRDNLQNLNMKPVDYLRTRKGSI
jgi:hypothetical protein